MQAVMGVFLGIWYNTFGGASRGGIEKNLINGIAYLFSHTGVLSVVGRDYGESVGISFIGISFIAIVSLVIFTTAHAADLEDMDGDAACGRKTLPLVLGENTARGIIAVGLPFWSLFTPWFMGSLIEGYFAPNFLATVIAVRITMCKGKRSDGVTYVFWNIWLISLYAIPLAIPQFG